LLRRPAGYAGATARVGEACAATASGSGIVIGITTGTIIAVTIVADVGWSTTRAFWGRLNGRPFVMFYDFNFDPDDIRHIGTTLPGFIIFEGSSARLMRSMS
jgi:hypothetical protein